MSLVLALPSKGRLKDQTEAWLADCGLPLETNGGGRGYQASMRGLDLEVRLASAADIATSLDGGDVHLGVTGEDLLGETGGGAILLMALGFGRADLVVAAPRSWLDVETMADLDEVAHDSVARAGALLRIATKYPRQTRAFFAAHGLADYRIIESGGATEGAPAAGVAELIVDITTTGATLAANGLKVLSDGVILESQARLCAAPNAAWDEPALVAARRLLSILEAAARGKNMVRLDWPTGQDEAASRALGELSRTRELPGLVARGDVFAAAERLAAAGVGPIAVERPAYVFQSTCETADRLEQAVRNQTRSRTSA